MTGSSKIHAAHKCLCQTIVAGISRHGNLSKGEYRTWHLKIPEGDTWAAYRKADPF